MAAATDGSRHLHSTMAHRLDKLEKFFSSKKKTTTSQTTASPRSSTGSNMSTSSFSSVHSDPLQPLFPPPSFIRPKASRMLARDDASHVPKLTVRLRSPPPPTQRASKRLSSDDDAAADEIKPLDFQSTNSSSSSLRIPNRSSSLLSRRRESPLNGMTPLQTNNSKRRSVDASTRLTIFPPRENKLPQPQPAVRYLQEALPIYPAPRVDTPPPSDQDDDYSPTTPPPDLYKCLPPAPLLSQPTPGPSPEMTPIRDSLLSDPRSSAEFIISNHLRTQSEEAARQTSSPQEIPLRKVVSDSNLPCPPRLPDINSDPVLEEPKYREFLTLSDDEIVGERKSLIPAPLTPARPPPRHLPPSPPVPPPSARIPVPAPLSPSRAGIMPSSPLTGVPAALAALEAARIAKKYDFDLVYIVNLWPNRVNQLHNRCASGASSSQSSPSSSPTSSVSPAPWLSETSSLATPRGSVLAPSDHGICLDGTVSCTGRNSGMTSRLLTGYGLAQLQHPFRLSPGIHKQFLRADGWVEFRQDDAKPEEFARGYACSFYTGHSSDGGRRPGSAPQQHSMQHTHANSTRSAGKAGQKKRRSRNNRGIVFAAYRKARSDSGSIVSGAAELSALHRDAETLVELLLDFHHVQRPPRGSEVGRRASEGSVPVGNNQ